MNVGKQVTGKKSWKKKLMTFFRDFISLTFSCDLFFPSELCWNILFYLFQDEIKINRLQFFVVFGKSLIVPFLLLRRAPPLTVLRTG